MNNADKCYSLVVEPERESNHEDEPHGSGVQRQTKPGEKIARIK